MARNSCQVDSLSSNTKLSSADLNVFLGFHPALLSISQDGFSYSSHSISFPPVAAISPLREWIVTIHHDGTADQAHADSQADTKLEAELFSWDSNVVVDGDEEAHAEEL
jgi:hypothetical protein